MKSSICSKTIFLLLTFLLIHTSLSSDSDPIRDFCIPNTGFTFPFLQCKNSSLATVQDFIFSGIKSPGTSKNGFAGVSVTSTTFPGLNTLGMSFVRADFEKGAINVPHYHPRATETVFVVKGKVYSGFVDTENRVFAQVIEEGEVMVFPKGLLHFQLNVGDSKATIFGSFNSQNPGMVKIPSAVFGSGINDELLEKAFGLKGKDIGKMKRRFGPQEAMD